LFREGRVQISTGGRFRCCFAHNLYVLECDKNLKFATYETIYCRNAQSGVSL
jgi:hypothetical protein